MTDQSDMFGNWGGTDPVEDARKILSQAIAKYQPHKVFALFSGGHDSLISTNLASQCGRFDGCVHVNTGIGIEETREFVRQTCHDRGWPLQEMSPPPFTGLVKCLSCRGKGCGSCTDGIKDIRKPGVEYGTVSAYESIVMHYGFPGAHGHTMIYNRLKERCVARLVKEQGGNQCERCGEPKKGHGRLGPPKKKVGSCQRVRDHKFKGRKIMLVTGVRKQESKRRMGYIVPHQTQGSRLWVAPIMNWTKYDKEEYLKSVDLPRNPVVGKLCMSGECLCGAFASPGELYEIEQYYPMAARYIKSLMEKASLCGSPHPVWGQTTKAKIKKSVEMQNPEGCMGLCWSCTSVAENYSEDTNP